MAVCAKTTSLGAGNGMLIERLFSTSGPPIAVTIISNGDAIMLPKI
jgi:hypothetical protein